MFFRPNFLFFISFAHLEGENWLLNLLLSEQKVWKFFQSQSKSNLPKPQVFQFLLNTLECLLVFASQCNLFLTGSACRNRIKKNPDNYVRKTQIMLLVDFKVILSISKIIVGKFKTNYFYLKQMTSK